MNTQPIGTQAVKLLSKLTGLDLAVSDITPQVVFMTNLIALLKGVIHADRETTEEEVAQFKQTLSKLNLNNPQTLELVNLLLSGVQKYKLYSEIDYFLILLAPLSESEKLLLFGLGYRMAMADSSLDEAESQYLRTLGNRIDIESRYLDVLEASFSGKSYNSRDLQELCDLVDPARFHDLGIVFVNAADNLQTALSEITNKIPEIEVPSQRVAETLPISTGDEYQKLQEFQIQKRSLLERVTYLSQLIDKCIKESLLPVTFQEDVQSIKNRLESQRFRVSVIGEFSQGKSTLLNALIGEEIQPMRKIPCSGTVSVLRYGDRKRVICHCQDGRTEEISVEQYRDKASISKEAAINNRGEELLKSNIKEIIFEHPNLLICRNGVEILDSPGLNEHPERTKITEQLLKQTDAILFMTDANKLLTKTEVDLIKDIQKQANGTGDKPLENLFLVVNFIDYLDTEEDRQDVQLRANNMINGLVKGDRRIHLISAKLALKATLNGTTDEYLTSFKSFTSTLESFLADERGNIEIQKATQKLNKLTQDCIHELTNQIDSVNINLSDSDKQQVLEKIGEASGRFITIKRKTESLRAQTIKSALDSWDVHQENFKPQIIKNSENWKTEHNPILSRDALAQDYVHQFNSDIQDAMNSWVKSPLINHILPQELDKLDKLIKQELDGLNASIASLDEKIGTSFSDSFQPKFNDFDVSYVAAWAAGGVFGGGGAAAVAFFLIPAFAIAPALIAGAIAAALLGGGFGAFAMVDAYRQIAKNICNAGFVEFEKSEESIKARIEEFINSTFLNRLESVDKLIKQVISECENRLEQEEKKHQEKIDVLRSSISSKKQEFEKLLSQ